MNNWFCSHISDLFVWCHSLLFCSTGVLLELNWCSLVAFIIILVIDLSSKRLGWIGVYLSSFLLLSWWIPEIIGINFFSPYRPSPVCACKCTNNRKHLQQVQSLCQPVYMARGQNMLGDTFEEGIILKNPPFDVLNTVCYCTIRKTVVFKQKSYFSCLKTLSICPLCLTEK